MMMPSLNLFSPPKVTIKRRRYVSYDDTDDHDDDNETSAPATTGTVVTCEYNYDDLDTEYSCPRLTKRQRRRCITLVPTSFTNRSLFVPILEDPEQETFSCTQHERGVPPPSLPFAYRQEEEEEERREGGRRISPSNYFDETTPFLQPKKKKQISLLQDIEQEEQPPNIEQEEQQGSRCCYLNPFSNLSPPPRMMINKSTRSNSSRQYLTSYPHYGSSEDTVQRQQQRQRQTPRRVLPTPSPFLSYSSSSSPVTAHNIDDTIVEQFQRAIRLSSEEQDPEELPSSLPTTPTTTTIKTPPSFDMLCY